MYYFTDKYLPNLQISADQAISMLKYKSNSIQSGHRHLTLAVSCIREHALKYRLLGSVMVAQFYLYKLERWKKNVFPIT